MPQAVKKSGVGASIGIALIKFGSLPIGLLAAVYFARTLGPDGFGIYSLTISIATIAAIFLGTGFNQFVLRETAQALRFNNDALLHGLLRRVCLGFSLGTVLLCILTVIMYYALRHFEKSVPVSLVFGIIFVAPMLGGIALLTGLLQAMKHPILAQFPNLFLRPTVGLSIAFAIGLVISLSPSSAILAQALGAFFALALSLLFFYRKLPKKVFDVPPRYDDRAWAKALAPFALITLTSSFNNELGIIMLGWLGDTRDVGGLRVAQSVAQLVSFPMIIGNMLLAPQVAVLAKEGNISEMRRKFVISARLAFLAALFIGGPMILWGKEIIHLAFGAEFSDIALKPLVVLVFAQLTNVFFGQTGMYLTMSGNEKETLKGQVLALVFLFLSGLILIPMYGAFGAALSVAIGLITWNAVLGLRLYQKLGIRPTAI